ncbi:hypothetical protein OUZ56_005969 [Daphnia magna]|uniref:Secreted protein n=1 Tax=Daphnia magna TaxID=35525 RepID=A0ABQ9YUA1_9CRUS|nr:hypothetical protein OUZ56_005969 [Daphnia magna]
MSATSIPTLYLFCLAFETAHSHSAIVINAHVVIGVSLALALIPARGTHELVRLSSFGHVVVHQTLLLPMVRKWFLQGLPANEAKALRLNFKPDFNGTLDLV